MYNHTCGEYALWSTGCLQKSKKKAKLCVNIWFLLILNKWIVIQMCIAKYTMVIHKYLHCNESRVWPVVFSNTPCFLFVVWRNPETFKFGGKFLEFSLALSFCLSSCRYEKHFWRLLYAWKRTQRRYFVPSKHCSDIMKCVARGDGWRFLCPKGMMLKRLDM